MTLYRRSSGNVSNVICCMYTVTLLRWSISLNELCLCTIDKFNLARLVTVRNKYALTHPHRYTCRNHLHHYNNAIIREEMKEFLILLEENWNRFNTYTQITHGLRIKNGLYFPFSLSFSLSNSTWLTRHNPHFTLKSTLNVLQKPITWRTRYTFVVVVFVIVVAANKTRW